MNAGPTEQRGIGKSAAGRPATSLTLPALLGYLFPVFAMLVGAWVGSLLDGANGAAALGAIAGFLGALAVARLVIGLMPAPQLIPLSNHSSAFPKE